ncbi:unnamed protein product [Closterium sp. NIES-53]
MAYISRCRELHDKLLRCGGLISEDAFVTVIIGSLDPQWRSIRAILRAHGKISEAALCAEIHAEQQDMDLQEERHKRKASVPEFAFHTQRRNNNNYRHQPKPVPPFCHLCKTSGHPQGLGYNLLSVSQLMAKGIHLKEDSTTQEFKLYHGKGGLYIGKAVMKNNVFVLDFVPDLGTADSDGIVTFTSWTHPPDLDPDFSPEGFWYSHTIPEAERTRALATIQHSAAAETTSAATETTSAAAKTTSETVKTTAAAAAAAAATSTPIAGPSTAPVPIDGTPPTLAQQLNPTSREVHRKDRDPTGGFHGDRAFASAPDEAEWDEQNVDNASEEAGPLPYCSVPIPMDDENPRESVNAETYFNFADTDYVTPAEVNTDEAECIGPNFIPDPETGDEAAYPADTTLPRYTQIGLQILGLVTVVHGIEAPKEPATVQQALGGEHREKWREAMDKELKALKERNTWKVVPIGVARNKTILTGKWVFRVKTKADGTIDNFKARWVVRGFYQEQGRDFTETFAPVSRHTSLRILLAIAAMKKKKQRQIDVANAFLYAPVDAEIYVELPHGSHGEPNQVCQLQKSLYGIKQAPRLWQQYLYARLTRIGFQQLPHDQGMYQLTKGDDYILLIVYVDDLLYIGSTDNITTWFEGELQKDLTLTVSSTVTQYLAVDFEVWLDDLQLFLQCDSKDGLSLFDLTSGASTAPAADADSTVRSQWTTRDAAARLAVRSHLPSTERAHFSQYKSAKTLYDAVVTRYSSPATAALSQLMLPYLFPDLAAFATVADLITHLRTSDTRYRAALPAEFCAKKPPPPHVHHPLLPSHPTP